MATSAACCRSMSAEICDGKRTRPVGLAAMASTCTADLPGQGAAMDAGEELGGGAVRLTGWTEERLRHALGLHGAGGSGDLDVDLKGAKVVLEEPLVVEAGCVTLRKGTVVAGKAWEGPRLLRVAGEGTRVVLEGVRLRGGGVQVSQQARLEMAQGGVVGCSSDGVVCEGGGDAELIGVEILGCLGQGACVQGTGSKLVIQAGSIERCRESGVVCNDGGKAEITEAQIAKCGRCGTVAMGPGSTLVVQGGHIQECRGAGVFCHTGGQAVVAGVGIQRIQMGACVEGTGSKLAISKGHMQRCAGGGVECSAGGTARLEDFTIEDCRGPGVVTHGGRVTVDGVAVEKCLMGGMKCSVGGRIDIHRSNIVGCHDSGISCMQSGIVEVLDTIVTGCGGWGVCVSHDTSFLVMTGGRISECKAGGLLSSNRGNAGLRNVEVVGCGGPGVERSRGGTVLMKDVRVDGNKLQDDTNQETHQE